MKKIYFYGEVTPLLPGLLELEKEMNFQICQEGEGFPVEISLAAENRVICDGTAAKIYYAEKSIFFRQLAESLPRFPEVFEKTTIRVFKELGAMFDLSRNGVMKPEGLKLMLRRMARMGYTYIWLYMEDTYEVKELPYFGYMRGRLTQEELSELDSYAERFGIELIPCIQTLGHLEKYLRWPAGAQLRDTANALLVGAEQTRDFLRAILKAATAPFHTKKIHLGMDEAWGLGSGRFLQLNGYKPSLEIMREHLAMVMEICRELKLEPVMWSDMFFRENDYNYKPELLSPERALAVRSAIPEGLGIVYWDYYHFEQKDYELQMEKHRQVSEHVVFAGGIWTWNGLTPNQGKAALVSEPALLACREKKISNVCCTLWGDNGSETSVLGALLSLQMYSEYAYRETAPNQEEIFESFAAAQGEDPQAFYDLRLLDELPGFAKGNPKSADPSKYLLYQNPLYGLFDINVENYLRDSWDGELSELLFGDDEELPSLWSYYGMLAELFSGYAKDSEHFSLLFSHYANLAEFLADKAELGCAIYEAYHSGSRYWTQECIDRCESLLEMLPEFAENWNTLWRVTNRAVGFEAIRIRLGALGGQLAYAKRRLKAFLENGERIEELETERLAYLAYGGEEGQKTKLELNAPLWDTFVAANPVSGV